MRVTSFYLADWTKRPCPFIINPLTVVRRVNLLLAEMVA